MMRQYLLFSKRSLKRPSCARTCVSRWRASLGNQYSVLISPLFLRRDDLWTEIPESRINPLSRLIGSQRTIHLMRNRVQSKQPWQQAWLQTILMMMSAHKFASQDNEEWLTTSMTISFRILMPTLTTWSSQISIKSKNKNLWSNHNRRANVKIWITLVQ